MGNLSGLEPYYFSLFFFFFSLASLSPMCLLPSLGVWGWEVCIHASVNSLAHFLKVCEHKSSTALSSLLLSPSPFSICMHVCCVCEHWYPCVV